MTHSWWTTSYLDAPRGVFTFVALLVVGFVTSGSLLVEKRRRMAAQRKGRS